MRLFLVLFLAVLHIGGTLQCSTEVYNRMYQFSMSILSSVTKKTNQNFVIAPTSVWANLMLLTKGASGETLKELQKLQAPNKRCKKKYYRKLMSQIKVEDYNLHSMRCAGIVVDRNMSLRFKGEARFDYGVLLIDVNDNNILESVEATNALISTATREQVNDSITVDFLNHTSVRVFDVNVLKTSMQIPLSVHTTSYIDFQDEYGLYMGQAKVINKTDSFKLTSLNIGCLVIEIPIPSMSDFSMLTFLPNRGVSVNVIIDQMKGEKLKDIMKKLHISKVRKMTLLMPRIKIKTNLSLNKHLHKLGISKMFNPTVAEFSNMGAEKYHVSMVNHYAEVELREEDMESVEDSSENRNVLTLRVNRPFVFMVVKAKSNIVAYAGVYFDPTHSNFE